MSNQGRTFIGSVPVPNVDDADSLNPGAPIIHAGGEVVIKRATSPQSDWFRETGEAMTAASRHNWQGASGGGTGGNYVYAPPTD
jgi:hypothetical protein